MNVGYQVVRKVEHPEVCEVVDVLDPWNFIGVEVQYIKLRQVLKVADILDIVLTKHKDP